MGTKGALINYEFVNCYENGRLGVPDRSGGVPPRKTLSSSPFSPPHPSSCDFVAARGVSPGLCHSLHPTLGRRDAAVVGEARGKGEKRRRERVQLCYLI